MRLRAIGPVVGVSIVGLAMLVGFGAGIGKQGNAQADDDEERNRLSKIDRQISKHAERMSNLKSL